MAAPIFSLPCAPSSAGFLQSHCPLEEVWRCKAKSKRQRSIKLNKTLADRAGRTRPRRDSSGRIQFAPTQPRHVSLCKCCREQLKHSSCVIGQISRRDLFFLQPEATCVSWPHPTVDATNEVGVPHFHQSSNKQTAKTVLNKFDKSSFLHLMEFDRKLDLWKLTAKNKTH